MFKIFPATLTHDRRKVPLLKDWQHLATDDPQQIQAWHQVFKDRLHFWALPTGKANGVLVLDVDVTKVNGFQTIQDQGLVVPQTLSQKTLNGGRHYFFKYPLDGRQYGNRVGFLPGLDIRADGGYVFYYGFDVESPLVDAPDWVLNGVAKGPAAPPASAVKVAPEIALAVIQTSLDAIREAPAGESNDILNREAFKLGQLVAGGSISREYAENELFKAAKERGKPDYEAKATIESGLNGGATKPITSPFGDAAPQATIEIPPPPAPQGRWTPEKLTRFDLLNTAKLRKPQLFQDWSSEDITITTADGGTGKTTLALYESICLALGERFLGFDCKQPGKTLYITGEDTEKKLAAMVGAICRQMGLLDESPLAHEKFEIVLNSIVIKKDSDLVLISKDRQGFLHPSGDAMRKLKEAIDDIQPKRIVFDPIASFWGSEAALNDMNKAVTKFMAEVVEYSSAQVEMINHMGKTSSQSKDMSQFAGRGGTGLPSNSRISRVYRGINDEEYTELTSEPLGEKQSAFVCNVNKYSDGSPLYNKQFIVIRDGYIFFRKILTPQKQLEVEKQFSDGERIFTFIRKEREGGKYPTKGVIEGYFMSHGDPISKERIRRAIDVLGYSGHMGEGLKVIDNPDVTIKGVAYTVVDQSGKEI